MAGRGLFAIAEQLTRDDIASPSAHDRRRNSHRSGIAWSKGAIRAVLANPRYTGRQVWNKQRKDESLIDVEDVGLGHVTRLKWNDRDTWVWSTDVVHEPLIEVEVFEQAQQVLAAKGAGRNQRERTRTRHRYVLRGLLYCGLCDRRMQGHYSHDKPYYRCRFPNEYALANKVQHPRNVYLTEPEVLGALDNWLATSFAPGRFGQTVQALHAAQPDIGLDPATVAAQRTVAECDAKLARHRAALEAGTDPVLVAQWTAEVQARRSEAQARMDKVERATPMSEEDISMFVQALGDIPTVLAEADPGDKAEVYQRLQMKLTYQPGQRTRGVMVCVRGAICTLFTRLPLYHM